MTGGQLIGQRVLVVDFSVKVSEIVVSAKVATVEQKTTILRTRLVVLCFAPRKRTGKAHAFAETAAQLDLQGLIVG